VKAQSTSAETKPDLPLEIAHLLLIDVVGYSKLLVNEQVELLQELNQIVRSTECFRAAEASGKLIRVPTGDGMALLFFHSPEEPVRCALEISKVLQGHSQIQVRMGVHSGPVNPVKDVNDQTNIAGSGINVAQRVLDCGDAGHILLSGHVAEDLAQYRHWQPYLHNLGECEVKHGLRLRLFNLCKDGLGNPQVPEKLKRRGWKQQAARPVTAPQWPKFLLTALVVFAVAATLSVSISLRRGASSIKHVPDTSEAAASGAEKSIAVLPFENLSANQENAFFTDGIQDEILTDLAKVADLKVISRTSVRQYKNTATRNLREIAQQLGVAHVLEGSVQRTGNRVRVSAQLIDARTDTHLWAERYDRDLANIFEIESDLAEKIVAQLKMKLSPTTKAAIEEQPTTDLLAYKLYLQAKELEATSSPGTSGKLSLLQAIRLLNEAVVRDPQFLLAYCLLSKVHLLFYWRGFDHSSARRDLANAAVQAALRLRPDAGEVHLALANYYYQGFRDYTRARFELDFARTAMPNSADTCFLAALIDRRQGGWTEATQNFMRAVELDPRNFLILQEAGFTFQALRRYSESSRLLTRSLAASPRDHVSRMLLAQNSFLEYANTKPLHALLSTILSEEPEAADKIAHGLFRCALAERDFAAMERTLAAIPPDGLQEIGQFRVPREWYCGFAAHSFGDANSARTALTAARAIEAKVVRDEPDNAPAWSWLGLIDAGLGRKEEAIHEGRRACELAPLSRDAFDGPVFLTNLAQIYAWTDEKTLAIEELARVARVPHGVSYGELKLDPQWDSLRGHPRFDKIVASLAADGTLNRVSFK